MPSKKVRLLILGLSPTAKYVAKEAALAGVICYGVGLQKGPAFYSKYFIQAKVLPEARLDAWLNELIEADQSPIFVCPTSDEWIEYIHQKAIFHQPAFKVDKAYLDGSFQQLADKKELKLLSEKLGLNYPKSLIFTGGSTVLSLEGLEFPLFCKPSNRAGLAALMKGKKGWILNNESEWLAFSQRSDLEGIELIIQEIIQGPESNIAVLGTVATVNKDLKSPIWVGAKVRQFPQNFGSGATVIQSDNKEITDIAKDLMAATSYAGFFALETKYCDQRKATYIIEVNTRPSLWFAASSTAKSQLVLHWLNSFGAQVVKVQSNVISKPVVWKYWYKDLAVYFLNYSTQNQLKYPKSYQKSYAVWDKKDPKPFFYDLWNGVFKLIQRKFRS